VTTRLGPVFFTLTALVGTWLGHGFEYVRAAGISGLGDGLSGPLHGYMIPAGVVLLTAAVVIGFGFHATLRDYQARIRDVGKQLALAMRGSRPSPRTFAAHAGGAALSGRALWACLTASQITLYALQENVEAASAGASAPGLGAITGQHWAAPLIQAAVAAVLALTTVALRRLVRRHAITLARRAALVGAVVRRLRVDAGFPLPTISRCARPLPARAVTVRGPPWGVA
jgi:hypothetical protein